MPPDEDTIAVLEARAQDVRRDIVQMLAKAKSGHPGGSLSCADIVVALYFHVMRHDPHRPDWPDRDRFLMSKGHCAPTWYSVLARAGYFPMKWLDDLRKLNSPLQGHPDFLKTPGVEMSSGSLGQGLSIANGMALAARLDGRSYRVYVLLGDGEIQEGQVWEAAMTSAHHKLDNLCAIIDNNGLQIDGRTDEVKSLGSIPAKWESFDWNVIEVDGHSMAALLTAFEAARAVKHRPTVIVARTVKGKGVSFMEHVVDYHGVAPTEQECARALAEMS
ncbi:MAG: transketolase [Candidatus Abyssobacteria bacterium SURF_17]|uniref:Transketolase n=1 Tax=Candidatus Abyssobacteria bacterium SURF_17 TaxID=2093361 RepID=A0A419ESW8_9BACT|nr:MAG: transketolase [Candidatus Abyssubacteria bacterium SURF_17]